MPTSQEKGFDGLKEVQVQDQVTFNTGILVIFGLIMVYMLFEAYKNKNKLKFGHEASLVCSLGLGISFFFLEESTNSKFTNMMEFNGEMFFYFVLPPIVFAAGFNMYRKKFFENFANIMLFGVLGTLCAFFAYAGVTLWMVNYFGVT
jgi:NhaP-type Na+/H+ or K+/H+ antiporter